MRVSVLVTAGRLRDAERAWRLEDLPTDPTSCVDLTRQGWREMEAMSCARLCWLTATRRFGEGRDLGLTAHGVRYHLRKLFTRLGVTSRAEAVRRGRELGAIPDDS